MKNKYFIFFAILFFVLMSSVSAEELNCYYNLSGLSSTLKSSTISNGDLTYTRQALRIHNDNSKDSNGKYVWNPTFSIGKYGCDSGQAASASNNYCGFVETKSNFAFFDLNNNVSKYTNSDISYAFNNVSSTAVASTSGVNSPYTKCPSTIYVGLNKYSISDPNIKYYIFSVSSESGFTPDGVTTINYPISKFSANNGVEPASPKINVPCANEIKCVYNDSTVHVENLVLQENSSYRLVTNITPVSSTTRIDSGHNSFTISGVRCPTDGTKFRCPEAIWYTSGDVVIADNGYNTYTSNGLAFFRFNESINGWTPTGVNHMIPLTSQVMNPELTADERANYLNTNKVSTFNDVYDPNSSYSSNQSIDVTPGSNSGNSEKVNPIYDYTVVDEFKFCDEVSVLRTLDVVHTLILIIRIIIPLTLIILASIDLFKTVTAGDEKALKESISTVIRRAIIGVIIFFIPTIVNSLLLLIDENNDEDSTFSRCTVCFTGKEGNCEDIIDMLKNN